MAIGLGLRGTADQAQPVLKVVVVGDAGDEAILDLEEGAHAEVVGLAGRFGQSFVRGDVGSVDEELGGSAGSAVGFEDDEIDDLLAVAAVPPWLMSWTTSLESMASMPFRSPELKAA